MKSWRVDIYIQMRQIQKPLASLCIHFPSPLNSGVAKGGGAEPPGIWQIILPYSNRGADYALTQLPPPHSVQNGEILQRNCDFFPNQTEWLELIFGSCPFRIWHF